MADAYTPEKTFYNGKRYVRGYVNAYVNSNADGSATIYWYVCAQFKWAYQYGVRVVCNIDGTDRGSASGYLSSNPGGSYRTAAETSGYTTISKGKSGRNVPVKVWVNLQPVNDYGGYYGSTETTVNVWVGAKTSYTVSFDVDGGKGAPDSQTKWWNEDLTLSSTKPTKTGYAFKGWGVTNRSDIDSKYKTQPYYQPGDTVAYNGNQTLIAIWEELTYTVKYNANGGTGAPGNQTKKYFTNLTLSKTIPTYEGYNFLYWEESSKRYNPGDSYTTNASTTMVAAWDRLKYAIRYDGNGGTGVPEPQVKDYDATATISTTKPTRQRYNFLGWSTSPTGDVKYHGGDKYSTNANLTLYAVWELAASRITFYDQDGKAHTGLCYTYDSSGEQHYAIITIYDSSGKPHNVI